MVEYVKETLMERQSGTEYSAKHQLVCRHIHLSHTQWSLHVTLLIVESFAKFVGNKLAHTHNIVAEQQTVGLIILVTHLRHILIYDGV